MIKSLLFFSLIVPKLAHAQTVQHGTWRTESTFEVNGLQMPPNKGEECLSKENAKDLKATLTKELSKIGCSSNKWIVKANEVDIGLKCNNAGLDAEGKMKGTVSEKKYNLSGDAAGTFQGFPAQAKINLLGNWVKACQ